MSEAELTNYDEESEAEEEQEESSTKGDYSNINDAGFKEMGLCNQLQSAITECAYEHPSTVQHECIPRAILGLDVLCQAQAGSGKTAVFVIATLQQLAGTTESAEDLAKGKPLAICICHTHELADQITTEFKRFTRFLPNIRTACFFGGSPRKEDVALLKNPETAPHIVVGTPGRLHDLAHPFRGHGEVALDLSEIKHFIVDECDKVLDTSEARSMRGKVQQIFMLTPKDKQVMMFSATLTEETSNTCQLYMQDPLLITLVGKEKELVLHGLKQYVCTIPENEKNAKLVDILDDVQFNQCIIFVDSGERATKLNAMLTEATFPSVALHSGVRGSSNKKGSGRAEKFEEFKSYKSRILVTTDLCARGVDVERVNVVINYDFPGDGDTYMHRVGRAGRFGTKGMAISFIRSDSETHKSKHSAQTEAEVFADVQNRFKATLADLPDSIDEADYK